MRALPKTNPLAPKPQSRPIAPEKPGKKVPNDAYAQQVKKNPFAIYNEDSEGSVSGEGEGEAGEEGEELDYELVGPGDLTIK